ncbi:hypothetical protein BDV93DRAFT_515708 [Ceratobasidium sp. AG-I]|nr:hypothetical protein BDV93DRAFT_515708 [Ceratobasidium sp. AG-I]
MSNQNANTNLRQPRGNWHDRRLLGRPSGGGVPMRTSSIPVRVSSTAGTPRPSQGSSVYYSPTAAGTPATNRRPLFFVYPQPNTSAAGGQEGHRGWGQQRAGPPSARTVSPPVIRIMSPTIPADTVGDQTEYYPSRDAELPDDDDGAAYDSHESIAEHSDDEEGQREYLDLEFLQATRQIVADMFGPALTEQSATLLRMEELFAQFLTTTQPGGNQQQATPADAESALLAVANSQRAHSPRRQTRSFGPPHMDAASQRHGVHQSRSAARREQAEATRQEETTSGAPIDAPEDQLPDLVFMEPQREDEDEPRQRGPVPSRRRSAREELYRHSFGIPTDHQRVSVMAPHEMPLHLVPGPTLRTRQHWGTGTPFTPMTPNPFSYLPPTATPARPTYSPVGAQHTPARADQGQMPRAAGYPLGAA